MTSPTAEESPGSAAPAGTALRFVDEFPLVREAQPYGGQTSGWFVILEELRSNFSLLPEPDLNAQAV
jgi:hypothetical protein